MHETFVTGQTVIRAFKNQRDAQSAAAQLHAAGFPDVRLSERSGETSQEHVDGAQGHTALDFAATLVAAGFSESDAKTITGRIEGGAVLVTVAAGSRSVDARTVLEGGTVASPALGPVDFASVDAVLPNPTDTARRHGTEIPPGAQVVQTRGEVLDVERRRTQGEARIRRETVTEQRTITVPVQHEELVVEREGSEPVRIPVTEDGDPAP